MKKLAILGTVFGCFAAAVPSADATSYLNTSALAFVAEDGASQACLAYHVNSGGSYLTIPIGQSSPCNSAVNVSGPVTHVGKPDPQSAQTVYVDGTCPTGLTITCTLFSFDYLGTYLGLHSHTMSGSFDQAFTLSAAEQTVSSYETIECQLPVSASAACQLNGYEIGY